MRVVGGIYRHRTIIYPDDAKHIRPTKDRVREAIFSALGDLNGYKGLDLYSGSGAMGIEGLSRGCSFMTFVDNNKVAYDTTKKNLDNLGIKNAELLFKNDFDAIDSFIQKKQKFDIVFLDPPYQQGQYEKVLDTLYGNDLLEGHAIIVMESDRDIIVSDKFFAKKRDYKYGDIKVAILWR